MTTQNAGEVFARLITLRNQAGATLYERLKLADQLLSDRGWVQAPEGGGGDESIAIDRLESLCFGDICGALSLPEMLEVLHAVPQVKVWEKNRFNLRRMYQEMKARQQAQRNATATNGRGATAGSAARPSTAQGAGPTGETRPANQEQEVQEELKHLRAVLRQRDEELQQLRRENQKLRKALRKVKEMLGNLQTV